jgi:hypothetical protein
MDVLRDFKAGSSKWINESGHVPGRFEWQTGYGAFSASQSQADRAIARVGEYHNHEAARSPLRAVLRIKTWGRKTSAPGFIGSPLRGSGKHRVRLQSYRRPSLVARSYELVRSEESTPLTTSASWIDASFSTMS